MFPDAAPDSEWGRGSPLAGATSAEQLDLLLVVDNSISMADKQDVLRLALPDFVSQLADRGVDLRVGVISTSIAVGPSDSSLTFCRSEEQQDDAAHLVATLPRATDLGIADGFLSWSPGKDLVAFNETLQTLIARVGEQGCGLEAPLESWYRFLVDPEPAAGWEAKPCDADNANPCIFPTGIDQTLLDQRAAFLRPGSALAIVMLTDDDDCSVRMSGGEHAGMDYYMARMDMSLWRASSVCSVNPNDPCCYSCGEQPPQGCAADPICSANMFLTAAEDSWNLRCFEQKRRFGTSFLYPVDRYLAALTNRQIATHDGEFVQNPLYPSVPDARGPSLVFLAGIVGVPWQDIAASDAAVEDLRFLSAPELADQNRWDVVLGNPEASPPIPPSDPLMMQSVSPRAGTSFTGDPLQGPSAGYMANPINGHEWNVVKGDDLQYACIFPLALPKDCVTVPATSGCDCFADYMPAFEQRPQCQDETGAYGTIQRFAKAYPSIRQLQVLKGLGNQAIVGSVCARNMANPTSADFGYRPVVRGLLDRLAPVLR